MQHGYLWQLRRVTCIALWTLLTCLGWVYALYLFMRLLIYGQRHFGWRPPSQWLPAGALVFVLYGVVGFCTIFVTTCALVMGMRGKLPGTRRRTDQPRGFPVNFNG